jgi:hypothetical protein
MTNSHNIFPLNILDKVSVTYHSGGGGSFEVAGVGRETTSSSGIVRIILDTTSVAAIEFTIPDSRGVGDTRLRRSPKRWYFSLYRGWAGITNCWRKGVTFVYQYDNLHVLSILEHQYL